MVADQGAQDAQDATNGRSTAADANARSTSNVEKTPATTGLVVGSTTGTTPAPKQSVRGDAPPTSGHEEVIVEDEVEEVTCQDAGEVPVQRVQTIRRVSSVFEVYEEIDTQAIGPMVDRLLYRVCMHVKVGICCFGYCTNMSLVA